MRSKKSFNSFLFQQWFTNNGRSLSKISSSKSIEGIIFLQITHRIFWSTSLSSGRKWNHRLIFENSECSLESLQHLRQSISLALLAPSCLCLLSFSLNHLCLFRYFTFSLTMPIPDSSLWPIWSIHSSLLMVSLFALLSFNSQEIGSGGLFSAVP